jgi:hypothetical protein
VSEFVNAGGGVGVLQEADVQSEVWSPLDVAALALGEPAAGCVYTFPIIRACSKITPACLAVHSTPLLFAKFCNNSTSFWFCASESVSLGSFVVVAVVVGGSGWDPLVFWFSGIASHLLWCSDRVGEC